MSLEIGDRVEVVANNIGNDFASCVESTGTIMEINPDRFSDEMPYSVKLDDKPTPYCFREDELSKL